MFKFSKKVNINDIVDQCNHEDIDCNIQYNDFRDVWKYRVFLEPISITESCKCGYEKNYIATCGYIVNQALIKPEDLIKL